MSAAHLRALSSGAEATSPETERQSHRSAGISLTQSCARSRTSQNSSRSRAPGKRPLMPIIAIGSLFAIRVDSLSDDDRSSFDAFSYDASGRFDSSLLFSARSLVPVCIAALAATGVVLDEEDVEP